MWANIVVKDDNYMIIRNYNTKEQAEKKFQKDVSRWIDRNENKRLFKLCRPFCFDTRDVPASEGFINDIQ